MRVKLLLGLNITFLTFTTEVKARYPKILKEVQKQSG